MRLLRRLWSLLRGTQPAPGLDESACYARLHGERDNEVKPLGAVQVARLTPKPARLLPRLSGEYLRRCFEKRLEAREHTRAA